MMAKWQFTKDLHSIGKDIYAYIQPTGGWGWSNAGLIVDGDEALLVDTLFDGRLTREMLDRIETVTGFETDDIGTIVNTHANGDHTFGNYLLPKAEIITSQASAISMDHDIRPKRLAGLLKNATGDFRVFMDEVFGPFHHEDDELRLPTRTFSKFLKLKVGDKDVNLIEVGPAHTTGDVLIHVPGDKTIFTGDILFIDNTPIMWEGPIRNWINACDLMLELDVDVVVPGHGPVTDKSGVRAVRDYLTFVDREARARYDAGLSAIEAAYDIPLGDYRSWGDAERIIVNIDRLYQEYSGVPSTKDVLELFDIMGQYKKRKLAQGGSAQDDHGHVHTAACRHPK